MSKINQCIFATLATILVCASPLWAARQELQFFSVEVPKGWEALQDENEIWFEGPAERGFSIEVVQYQRFNADELLRSAADEVGLARLTPLGSGYVWQTEGDSARFWLGIGKDGMVCRIRVPEKQAQVGDIVGSLRGVQGCPQLAELFTKTNPDLVRWLDFSTPTPKQEEAPEFPDVPETAGDMDRTVSHGGLTAEVAKGWTVTQGDKSLTLTSPDPGTWMTARAINGPELMGKGAAVSFEALALKVATDMGGFNIHFPDGEVRFQLPDGVRAEMSYCEQDCLLLTSRGNPALLDVARNGLALGLDE